LNDLIFLIDCSEDWTELLVSFVELVFRQFLRIKNKINVDNATGFGRIRASLNETAKRESG